MTDSMCDARPAPWSTAPDGFHFEVVPQPEWLVRINGDPPRSCRYGAGPGKPACGKPAVATLMRGRPARPWAYCADHLYGRWIENGAVVGWRLVKDDADA